MLAPGLIAGPACFRRRYSRNQTRAIIRASPAQPPTTPPAIAPLLVDSVEGEVSVSVSAGASVGVSVGVTVAEGARDALGVPRYSKGLTISSPALMSCMYTQIGTPFKVPSQRLTTRHKRE